MKATGPFLNRNFYDQDRPRALFSGVPIGVDYLADFQTFFDDFKIIDKQLNGAFTGTATGTAADVAAAATLGGASPTAAQVDTAIDTLEVSTNLALKELQALINAGFAYTVVKDTGATVTISADAENGAVVLTSTGTTDNDGASIQLAETTFLCKAGNELMFEARVKVSDADQGEMFIGLADNFITDPEAVIVNGVARIGFELIDGAATINTVQDNDTTATKYVTAKSMADATYVRLGFRIDGASIRYYVDRHLVYTVALSSAIAAVTMSPAFMHISGDATGTHTAACDYILVCSKRE